MTRSVVSKSRLLWLFFLSKKFSLEALRPHKNTRTVFLHCTLSATRRVSHTTWRMKLPTVLSFSEKRKKAKTKTPWTVFLHCDSSPKGEAHDGPSEKSSLMRGAVLGGPPWSLSLIEVRPVRLEIKVDF